MEQRRFFLSLVTVSVFLLIWMQLAPRLFPGLFPKPGPKPAPQAAQPAAPAELPEDADGLADVPADRPRLDDGAANVPAELSQFPLRQVALGSLDPDSGFFMQVNLTSAGAAIESVELNDPRYTTVYDRSRPIKIVGNNPEDEHQSLALSLQQIDAQLLQHDTSLREVNWEVVPNSLQHDEVTFRYRSPDGRIEVRKHFVLNQGDNQARDVDPLGYLLQFELEFENLGGEPAPVDYVLQGPVGLPLEQPENARTFIEIKAGVLEDPSDPTDVTDLTRTATEIIKDTEKARAQSDPNLLRPWRAPLKFVGADVQFFAALLFPGGNQIQTPDFDEAVPQLIQRREPEGWSDISVKLGSVSEEVPPGETLQRSSRIFFGPKRSDLLEPLGAGGVIQFGWFGMVSVAMLGLLNFFHRFVPYGMAIILLTIFVRACLFPISRKQALNAKRMKELQPKMQEIRERYKDDKQKMAESMQEFMVKNRFNPLSGCLPMFLQLPILIGLYQALYNSVDLRLSRFLWVDNLAAPDALFQLPFELPFVGTQFNLLPLITIVLFYVQQKLFMPPPTSDEQAMQYKMMNFMMLFMGVLFYRVPAGLCVYFIASTLWGIGERKMLDFTMPDASADASVSSSDAVPDKKAAATQAAASPPKPPGFLGKLMQAADQARQQSNANTNANGKGGGTREERRAGGNKRSKGRR